MLKKKYGYWTKENLLKSAKKICNKQGMEKKRVWCLSSCMEKKHNCECN
jgi:hypothetical protein